MSAMLNTLMRQKIFFHKLGFEVDVLDIAQETEEVIKEKLNHTPILLHFTGGNTFCLLQRVERKHLLPHIKKQVIEGMLYLGGDLPVAIVTASDIEYNPNYG